MVARREGPVMPLIADLAQAANLVPMPRSRIQIITEQLVDENTREPEPVPLNEAGDLNSTAQVPKSMVIYSVSHLFEVIFYFRLSRI